MSIYEHFKDQPVHQNEGKDCWYVLTDKDGPLALHHIPISEMDKFLEGTTFVRMAGEIARFDRPRKSESQDASVKS